MKKIINKNNYNDYVNSLLIGKDGSFFSKNNFVNQKKYGLNFLFNCALTLKYLDSDKLPNTGLSLTVEELLFYLKNADFVMRDLKSYHDDLVENNPYNIKVLNNPSSIKILEDIEISELIKGLRNKKSNYLYSTFLRFNVSPYIVDKKDKLGKPIMFLVLSRNIKYLDLIDIEKLSQREKDAFFGETAKKILNKKINTPEKDINPKEYIKK